jgi:hypothetical protein
MTCPSGEIDERRADDCSQPALACGYKRAFAFEVIREMSAALPDILSRPGPVFIALKVYPEVENAPIGQRRRWQTRSRGQVLRDLRQGFRAESG